VGSVAAIFYTAVMSAMGIVLISAGAEGFLFRVGRLGWISRIAMIVLGILFFFPARMVNLWGCIALILFVGFSLLRQRGSIRAATE
jgi:TRAP-type uncharacterized transport system fused permease subunit